MSARDHDDERATPLRIRTRQEVAAAGTTRHAGTVACPRQAHEVAVNECLHCDHCRGLERDDGRAVAVRCGDATARAEARGRTDAALRREPPTLADATPLRDLMTSDVVCVRDDLPLEQLVAALLEHGVHGVPVIDAAGRAIGVASSTDILRAQATGLSGATVADVMSCLAFTLPEYGTVSHAAAMMAIEGVHRIPVVSNGGRVVGIVSALDIARWLARRDGYAV